MEHINFASGPSIRLEPPASTTLAGRSSDERRVSRRICASRLPILSAFHLNQRDAFIRLRSNARPLRGHGLWWSAAQIFDPPCVGRLHCCICKFQKKTLNGRKMKRPVARFNMSMTLKRQYPNEPCFMLHTRMMIVYLFKAEESATGVRQDYVILHKH